MKQIAIFRTAAFLVALSLSASYSLAAISQPASTFSAGGGVSTSGGYENLGVIGQPAIVDSSIGATYTANHGFLSVLGDGFKILYPVITATPGTLTFYLKPVSSGSHPFTISNSGGSTLNWSVSKGSDPKNVFSLDTAGGTNSGTVIVTANTASQGLGPYSSSLTISGAGISQTVQVLLNLTVTDATYTLAVTLKQAVPGKGGGTVTSTSPDSSLTCSNVGASADVLCSAPFTINNTVTLSQTRGSDSQWATWGSAGCGTNPDCQVVLDASKGMDVIFPYSSMAQVVSSSYVSDSLLSAYANAIANPAPTDTINARAVTFVEGTPGSLVTLNGGKTITLVGGLDAFYAPTSGYTTLRNILNLGGSGRLNIKGAVKIQKAP
jgi:hypothetical protein